MQLKNLTLAIISFLTQIGIYIIAYELLLMFFTIEHRKPELGLRLGAHYAFYILLLFAAIQSFYVKKFNFKLTYWLILAALIIFLFLFLGIYRFYLTTVLPSIILSSILAMSVTCLLESKKKID